MRRKLLAMALSESCSRLQWLKQARLWQSRRYSRIRDIRIENCKFWKCCTTQTAWRWGSHSTQTVISQTRFTSTSWWTSFLIRFTESWSNTWRWNKWCPISWLRSMPTSWWGLSPTFTPLVSATETLSPRMCSLTPPLTFWNSVTSEVPSS